MKPRDCAVTLVVPLVVVAVLALPAFDRVRGYMRGYSMDVLFTLRNWTAPPDLEPAQSPSVVVALDERTYQTAPFEGRPKVLWTNELAAVVNGLIDAGAAVIGFDMILSTTVESVKRNYDREFRRALRRAADQGKLVLGAATVGQRSLDPLDIYRFTVRGSDNIRSLNLFIDADGVIRHVPLFFQSAAGNTTGNGGQGEAGAGPKLVASMSLTLASRKLEVAPSVDETGSVVLGDYKIPARIDRNLSLSNDGARVSLANNMVVDLYQGPFSIPTYSFAALYHCAAAGNADYLRRHFQGKVVLIGAVLDLLDRKRTSIRFAGPRAPEPCVQTPGVATSGPAEDGEAEQRQRRSIPGVYIHAAAVNNIVLEQVLNPVGRTVEVALTAALALAMALCVMTTGAARSGVAFVTGSAAWTGVATTAFISGWVLPLFHPIAASFVTLVILLGYRFFVTDRMERHIRKAYSTVLSPAQVERMIKENQIVPTQGGDTRTVTVWISDLENYSTISELLPPTELVKFLNDVYTVMSDTIEEHGGCIPQFVGDAVVAAFNAHPEDLDHARHGIEAAMACCDRVAELRETLELPPGFNLRIRIGISTGTLLAGFIGSKRKLSFSVVGDDINLASRLEGVNKVYGSTILVNGVTKDLCGSDLAFREIDVVRVKGRDTPVRIFEPLGKSAVIGQEQDRRLQAFAGALAAFRERRFEAAAAAFDSLAESDPVSMKFAERAREMAADPPPDDWDGVHDMLTK